MVVAAWESYLQIREMVKQRLSKLWPLLLVVMVTVLGILAFPYLASAYHVEAGGRALTDLTSVPQGAQVALEHLQKAIKWDPTNAHAYRLLAKVHHVQGDQPAAVKALVHYRELRPRNPLAAIELAELYEELGSEMAAEAWRDTSLAPEGLIARGDALRAAQQYNEALEWYQRAVLVEPGLGDPWYQIGQLYEAQEQWPEALAAYERATTSTHFHQVGRGSAFLRIGVIHHRHLNPPQLELARSAYEAALAANDFATSRDAAWPHARLGQIAYDVDKNAAKAEAKMLTALGLAPEDKWLYYVVGEFYRKEGRILEARRMYEQALAINPNFEEAQKRLSELK